MVERILVVVAVLFLATAYIGMRLEDSSDAVRWVLP